MEDNRSSNKQTERRIALLALAANRQKPVGSCLSSEEMASLVEQQTTEEEERAYQKHLSSCDTCYKEWQALSQMKLETTAQKRQSRLANLFNHPKGLAIVGSTLAIAASLMIFLNIPRSPLEISTKDEMVTPSVEKIQIEEKVDLLKKPLPAAPKAMESKAPLSTQQQEKIQATMDTSLSEGEEERKSFESPAEAKSHRSVTFAGKNIQEDNEYLTEILSLLQTTREACSKKEYNEKTWKNIHTKAHTLRTQLERRVSRQKDTIGNFLKLEDLTHTLTPKNMSQQCRKILLLLEEEAGNR